MGTVMRRTVVAMAVTLLLFLAVRLPVEGLVRPHYLASVTTAISAAAPDPRADGAGNWILQGGLMDQAGHKLNNGQLSQVYSDAAAAKGNAPKGSSGFDFDAYLQVRGYVSFAEYQPADRFWTFQGIEAAFYVGLAVLLLGFTAWWVRSRSAG